MNFHWLNIANGGSIFIDAIFSSVSFNRVFCALLHAVFSLYFVIITIDTKICTNWSVGNKMAVAKKTLNGNRIEISSRLSALYFLLFYLCPLLTICSNLTQIKNEIKWTVWSITNKLSSFSNHRINLYDI